MQLTSIKEVEYQAWLGENVGPLGIVQETGTWPYYQMVYVQCRIHTEEWDH